MKRLISYIFLSVAIIIVLSAFSTSAFACWEIWVEAEPICLGAEHDSDQKSTITVHLTTCASECVTVGGKRVNFEISSSPIVGNLDPIETNTVAITDSQGKATSTYILPANTEPQEIIITATATVPMPVSVGENECGPGEEYTLSDSCEIIVFKVEIKHWDESSPRKYIAVGKQTSYKAVVTPDIPGEFKWFTMGEHIKIDGNKDTQVVTILGLKAGKKKDDDSIHIIFTPDDCTTEGIAEHFVTVFGGDIVPPANDFLVVYKKSDGPTEWFKAAPNQPPGVKYSWLVSEGKNWIKTSRNTKKAQLKVRTRPGVDTQQLAELELIYKMDETLGIYDHKFKLRRPKSLAGSATTDFTGNSYTTIIIYTVKDQFGDALSYRGIRLRERFSFTNRWGIKEWIFKKITDGIGVTGDTWTDASGQFRDKIYVPAGIPYYYVKLYALLGTPLKLHQWIDAGGWLVKEHDMVFERVRAYVPGVEY